MEHRGKRAAFVLAVILVCAAAGCRNVPRGEAFEDVPVIYIGIAGSSGARQNLEPVNRELKKISGKKAGVCIQLVATGLESGDNGYKNRQLGVDIFGMYYRTYCSCLQKNLLLNMEDYLDGAPALTQVLKEKADPQKFWKEGVYGIPKPISDLHTNGALLNREYVERYGFDVSRIKTPEDLEPLFDVILEREPKLVPWALEKKGNMVLERRPDADILDGCLSGILYEDNEPVVCNVFETEGYEEEVYRAKRWQERGYLAKDVLTCIESGKNQVVAGDAFATECVIKSDETQYDESMYGDRVIVVPFDKPPVLDTEDDWVYVWGISAGTKYPKEAVEALNLLYSYPDVLNLVLYGVEGKDYEVKENGSFGFIEGETRETVEYFNNSKWKYNTLQAGIWDGMSQDLEEDFRQFEASAIRSVAYGFWLDEGQITVDMEKIRQVIRTYTPRLKVGLCDTEEYLREFHQKLREAGAEQLVYEVQQQLDEWIMTEKEQ